MLNESIVTSRSARKSLSTLHSFRTKGGTSLLFMLLLLLRLTCFIWVWLIHFCFSIINNVVNIIIIIIIIFLSRWLIIYILNLIFFYQHYFKIMLFQNFLIKVLIFIIQVMNKLHFYFQIPIFF